MKDVLFNNNATDGTGTAANINRVEIATEAAALSAKFPLVDSSIITIFATAKTAGVTPTEIESALKTISGEEKAKRDNIDADIDKMKADYPDADLDLLCAMAYAKSAGFESKTARSIIELCDPEEAAKKLTDANEEAAKFKKEADEAKKEAAAAKKEADEAKKKADVAKKEADKLYATIFAKPADTNKEIAEAKKEAEKAKKEADEAKNEAAKANEEIAKAMKEADEAKKEVAEAKKEAAEARKEADEAKKEAADAKKGTAKAAKPNDGAIVLCTGDEQLVDGEKLLVVDVPICLTKAAVRAAQKGNESNSIKYRLYSADEDSIKNTAPTEEEIKKYVIGQAEIKTEYFFDKTKIVLL